MQLGESFIGTGANAAHVNTVLGPRDGPVGTAWATALASPSAGHAPFVVVLRPGLPVRPYTLFVNKAAIASDRHAELTWGAAQAGVAAGVADALADGWMEDADAVCLAAVWVNPAADDAAAVFDNNREATRRALVMGHEGGPSVEDVVKGRHDVWNAYFRSR